MTRDDWLDVLGGLAIAALFLALAAVSVYAPVSDPTWAAREMVGR